MRHMDSIQKRMIRYGIRRLARQLRVNPSMVSRWARFNIPAWRLADVKRALANAR